MAVKWEILYHSGIIIINDRKILSKKNVHGNFIGGITTNKIIAIFLKHILLSEIIIYWYANKSSVLL